MDNAESGPEDEEDKMIDIAEKIFVRIADEMVKKKVTVRQVMQPYISLAEIDGEPFELLSPEGLIESIQDLGINELEYEEISYLLKVLQKPELEGAILMQEFLQIMENFGLYDDEEQPYD